MSSESNLLFYPRNSDSDFLPRCLGEDTKEDRGQISPLTPPLKSAWRQDEPKAVTFKFFTSLLVPSVFLYTPSLIGANLRISVIQF